MINISYKIKHSNEGVWVHFSIKCLHCNEMIYLHPIYRQKFNRATKRWEEALKRRVLKSKTIRRHPCVAAAELMRGVCED